MKSFIDFSENLDDKKKQLMQKQRVMQQMERERASRSNQEFQQDKEEKQSRMDQEKEEAVVVLLDASYQLPVTVDANYLKLIAA